MEFKNWAEKIYVDYIQQLTNEQYHQVILNKSVHQIFYHLYEVMHHWYSRIAENYTEMLIDESSNREELLTEYYKINQLINEFVVSGKYTEFTLQWWDDDKPVNSNSTYVLFNFVTHSAYHRGQLALLLRQLGFDEIKETDFNPWIYEIGQN